MGPVQRFTPVAAFVFRLPPTLLLCAPIGAWPQTPRGVTLTVTPDGTVEIACTDASELYGRSQVLTAAGDFLRAIEKDSPPLKIRAALTVPSWKRPIGYMISVGAWVSICAHRRSARGVRQSAADSAASRAPAREGCDGGVSRSSHHC